jgi:hypothetical protein
LEAPRHHWWQGVPALEECMVHRSQVSVRGDQRAGEACGRRRFDDAQVLDHQNNEVDPAAGLAVRLKA